MQKHTQMSQEKDAKTSKKPDATDDDKPFLSRWSQRKGLSRSGNLAEDTEISAEAAPDEAQTVEESETEKALSDEALCEKYELVHPDKCETPEQLDSFFTRPLPDRLKQLAMRRMWRINPIFRFADEMVEYGEDFTDAATVIPDMATAYKVGKGYFDKLFVENDETDEAGEAKKDRQNEALADAETAPEAGQEDSDEALQASMPESDSQSQSEILPSPPAKLADARQQDDENEKNGDFLQPDEIEPRESPENSDNYHVTASQKTTTDSLLEERKERAEMPKPQPRRMVFKRNL